MSKDTEDAEEGTLRGRRFACSSDHKKKANGISALVEGCRDEGNSSGNSSSLFRQHLQKTQMAPHQHEGRVMSDIIVSPLPSQASGDKDSLPSDPYIRLKEMLSRRAEPSTGAALFGTSSFDPERHQTTEVTRNLHKRKRASEEPSQAPSFFPSFGRLCSLDGHAARVPSPFGSSDAMSTRAVPQVVSDNGKRVLENPQEHSSESIFMRPLPCMNLDKGKQVAKYPSIYLKLDQQGQLSIAGLRLAPAPTPPATAIATAALDKGKQALEEPIQASALVSDRAQPISKGQFPPSLLDQINRSSGL